MVLFNYSTKELTAKLVYYGAGLCGKTTNLQFIHDKLPIKNKGKMLSLATEADRTLFFDFLPIDLGTIRGMKTRIQLYTVPGQVFYNATRRMVLKGADCVVFVADSQAPMLDANLDSLQNMRENLQANEIDPDEIPMVFQYNKRDLPNALPTETLNERLNPRGLPWYEAVAPNGQGVEETLKAATALVFRTLSTKYGAGAAGAGATAPGVGSGRSRPTAAAPAAAPPAAAPPATAPPAGPRAAARVPAPPDDELLEGLGTDTAPGPVAGPQAEITAPVLDEPPTHEGELDFAVDELQLEPESEALDFDDLEAKEDAGLELEPAPGAEPAERPTRPGARPRPDEPPPLPPTVAPVNVEVSAAPGTTELTIPLELSLEPGTTRLQLRLQLTLNLKLPH